MKANKNDLHESGRPLTKEEFINKIKTDDEFAKKWGDLGPIYGKQWRRWENSNMYFGSKPFQGYTDQIANLIRDLKTNPDSRRLMVNAWNVTELDSMVLPPCHYGFQCWTRELSEKERMKLAGYEDVGGIGQNIIKETVDMDNSIPRRAISLIWNQRSVDTFLGLPFNIASYGLLLEIIAKEVNMVPDELIGNLGDTHLYLNHIEQAKEQIGREYTLEEQLPKKIKLFGHGGEMEFTLTNMREIKYHSRTNKNNENLDRIEKLKDNEVFYQTEFGWGIFLNTDTFETVSYDGTEWGGHKLKIPTRTREPFPLPTLKHMTHLDEFKSWLFDDTYGVVLRPKDFILDGYQSHPAIKAPLSN